MRKFFYQHIYALPLIILCGAIAFSPALSADFINYDDPEYVINNPYIRNFSISSMEAIFSGKASLLYVPLTIFSYLIEYSIFGENATVFHFTNLLLHLVNVVLIYWLLLKLDIKNVYFITWILLFFAVNPLLCESVCWITERKDVLYSVFFLSAILQFLEYDKRKNTYRLVTSLFFFILACFCKPMAISFPFLLLIYRRYRYTPVEVSEKIFLFLALVISAVFGLVSVYSLSSADRSTEISYTLLQKIYLTVSEMGYYFFKPFFPINQQLINPFPAQAAIWKNQAVFLYALAGILVITSAGYTTLKSKDKTISFLFIAWFVFLIPVLQFYPNTYSYVSERYFYISIIFPAAIVFLFFEKFKATSYALTWSIIPVLICFSFMTYQRSSKWLNSGVLFEEEVRMDTTDTYALTNLGLYYNTKAEFSNAEQVLAAAMKLKPGEPLILNNYGWALAGEGQIDEALIYFNKAFRLKRDYVPALNNIGICHLSKNQVDSALIYLDKSYRLDNTNNETAFNIAACYLQRGQVEYARPWLMKARALGNTKAEKYLVD